jgi:hypothetical protein
MADAAESLRTVVVRSYGSAVKRRLAPADTEDERYMNTSLFCLAEEASRQQARVPLRDTSVETSGN